MGESVLDNPIWWSLAGRHAHLALRHGQAARYLAGITPLAALAEPGERALADLAEIVAPGDTVGVWTDAALAQRCGWRLVHLLELCQMVCVEPVHGSADGLEALSTQDGDEMLALAQRTEPGPFSRRSVELGRFLGVRDDARLVAMAGERFAPPDYTELSGVCTHPDARGRGLGDRLVRAISAGIQQRGQTAFLHVAPSSPSWKTSRALYERVGYRERRRAQLSILTPG